MPASKTLKRKLNSSLPEAKRAKITAHNLHLLERATPTKTSVWVDRFGSRHEMPNSSASTRSRRTSSQKSIVSSHTSRSARSSSIYGPSTAVNMARAGILPLESSKPAFDEDAIRQRLDAPRPSLSPIMLPSDFQRFQRTVQGASNEASLGHTVLPKFMPADRYGVATTGFNASYSNMPSFDNVPLPKPDAFDGVKAVDIKPELASLAGPVIYPAGEAQPALPNFTVELKGPQGSKAVAKRQIVNNSSVGLRCFEALRRDHSPALDGVIRSFGAVIDADSVEIYGTHSVQTSSGTQYHTRILSHTGYIVTPENLNLARTQFRNAREIAFKERRRALAQNLLKRTAPEDAGDTDSVSQSDSGSDSDDESEADEEHDTVEVGESETDGDATDEEEEWYDAKQLT